MATTASASAPAAASAPVIDVLAWCLPQSAECVAPDDPCAGVAPPGRTMGLRVRIHEDGRPVPWARVTVVPDPDSGAPSTTDRGGRGDDRLEASITNREGVAVIALAPQANAALRVETADGATGRLSLKAFWGGLAAGPTATVFEGPRESAIAVDVAARLEGVGRPPDLPLRVVLESPSGELVRSDATGGVARFLLERAVAGSSVFTVVDGAPCRLPVVARHPVTVVWNDHPAPATPAPRDATLSFPRIPSWVAVSPFVLEPVSQSPYEWRSSPDAAWLPGPIVLGDGEHRIEARAAHRGDAARDGADPANETGMIATAIVRVDGAAPELLFAGHAGAWWPERSARWIVRDAVSKPNASAIRAVVDGRAASAIVRVDAATGDGTIEIALEDGERTIALETRDHAGHVARWEGRLRVDATPPRARLDAEPAPPGPDRWTTVPVRIAAAVDDDASGVRNATLTTNGAARADLSPFVLEGEGAWRVELVATDGAGHATRIERLVRVDTLAPRIAADDSWGVDDLRFDVVDEGSGVRSVLVKAGNLSVPATRGPEGAWTASRVSLERYTGTATIVATDEAGNVFGREIAVAPVVSNATAPRGAFAIQSIVISPADPSPGADVRVTAIVTGIRAGSLALEDASGRRHVLGAVAIEDGRLVAEGQAPAPGRYAVLLLLETESGSTLEHRDRDVVVAGPQEAVPESTRTPDAPAAAALVALAFIAFLARRRRA